MTQTVPSILVLAIPQAIPFLFYLVALIYVLSKHTDRRTAKTYVAASLAIMFATQLALLVSNTVMANMLLGSYVFAYAISASIASSLNALAIAILIAAAFTPTRRDELRAVANVGRVAAGNDNPYAPPTP